MLYQHNRKKGAIRDVLRMAAIIMTGAFQNKYKQPKLIENGAMEGLKKFFLQRIDSGEINEVENELWNRLDYSMDVGEVNVSLIEMVLEIYGYINEKDDEFLRGHDYSREEIKEGIQRVLKMVGIELPTELM